MKSSPLKARTWRFTPSKRHWITRIILLTPVALSLFFIILILTYRFIDPPLTTLMAGQITSGRIITQNWIPLEKMSQYLPLAVIVSEDARFCEHRGVDWLEIKRSWSGKSHINEIRGASTIPMQTMKNLFLWPGRNILRKSMEIPLSYASSSIWSKKRMLEIYLNIAEWGPGVFGAESASQYHFKKRASQLNRYEAALLAASLPNPIVRKAGNAGPNLRLMANLVQKRMVAGKRFGACVR